MQFTRSLILLATAALAAAATSQPKSIGCFTDLTATTSTSDSFNSVGMCHTICSATTDHFAVKGMDCLCLDALPEAKTKVDDKKCAVECPGYPAELCGGEKEEYTVYSGNKKVVENMDYDESSSTSAKAKASSTASESASLTASPSASASATEEVEAISSVVANATQTASNSTATQQPAQDEDSAAAGRSVVSVAAAAVMVAAGLAML